MKLPIGIDDFKELVQNGYHFVDKSLFIKDVIEDGSKVILITRPRRFGKTSIMSMLYYYVSNNYEQTGNLFDNLEINQNKKFASKHYHQYPTIFITFKDAKSTTYDDTIAMLAFIMAEMYRKYKSEELFAILDPDEKRAFESILDKNANITELKTSLSKLIEYLHRLYNKQVIVLIDEYDTPIHAAYANDYYDDFIDVFKTFLGIALKGNKPLYKAVITGITRVAQSSIFSELNHFEVYSVLREYYGQYFGFTEHEVIKLLDKATTNNNLSEIKSWYNGYKIGRYILYNPWSILNCLKQKGELAPYWLNTSDNKIIKSLINKAKPAIKNALTDLLQGKITEQPIKENLVFQNLDKSEEAVWALLLYSGYLNIVATERKDWKLMAQLSVPNKEVMIVYEEIVANWFGSALSLEEYDKFIDSLVNGDLKTFERVLADYIAETGSYFDFNTHTKEQVFHCLILGLVLGLRENYIIKSNQEAGYGRFDVALIPKDNAKTGIILELKTTDKESELEAMANTALEQIKEKKYTVVFKEYGIENILLIGIAFCGKKLKLITFNDKLKSL